MPAHAPKRRRSFRLWPLLLLMPVGVVCSLVYDWTTAPRVSPVRVRTDTSIVIARGLVWGCATMMMAASAVFVFRITGRRLTIRSLLITVAVIAFWMVLLRGIRFF